jgi:phosphoglycolate phosphatase-like HAD superfamily hydrolase
MDAQDHVCRLRGEGLIVEAIKAVLFEPVGCLAEFRPDEFVSAAADLFGAGPNPEATGSQAYWRLLGLMEQRAASAEMLLRLQQLELQAVEHAELYEDVRWSLEELKSLGVAPVLASSLSRPAVARFIERHALADLLAGAVTRDEAGGVMGKVLRAVIEKAQLVPAQVMALADTAEGLAAAKQLGRHRLARRAGRRAAPDRATLRHPPLRARAARALRAVRSDVRLAQAGEQDPLLYSRVTVTTASPALFL